MSPWSAEMPGPGGGSREELVKRCPRLSVSPPHLVDLSSWSPGALSFFSEREEPVTWSLELEKASDLSDSHSLEHSIHSNQFQNLPRANISTSLLWPKIPLPEEKEPSFRPTTVNDALKMQVQV